MSYTKVLHRWIVESDPLFADMWSLYTGLYPMPVKPVAGVPGASNHEIARRLARSIFRGVCLAADSLMAVKSGPDATEFDYTSIVRNWPCVREYLLKEAPHFDASEVCALLDDEAARAEEKHGKDKLNPKGDQLFLQPFYGNGRGCLWLSWYESAGTTTHRSYAAIRDKWNLLPDDVRQAVDPKYSDKLLTDTGIKDSSNRIVKSAIDRAKRKRKRKADR
jgi:hypothetical protein